jgi:NAD(P)-dependent dehydrogenase (short-subunit alcohol dehydrogenase family)
MPADATTSSRSFDLSGKVVAICGGAGILGREMVAALCRQGATVAVVDRTTTALAGARFFECDITSRSALVDTMAGIAREMGDIDVLVNNAAAKSDNFFAPFEEFPETDWDEVMAVNVKGAVSACQIVGPIMAARGRGSIINTLSVYGIVAPDQRIYEGSLYEGRAINTPAVYSASKAALWGLTKYLAAYWGHRNIRVNAITPGGTFSGQNDMFVDRYSTRVPLGRMAKPEEMGGAVVYLASDASSYVTGQNIVVDGGLTAW